jgi:hypothetical protein
MVQVHNEPCDIPGYYNPGVTLNYVQQAWRWRFLTAAKRLAPQIFTSLRSQVLPIYRQASERIAIESWAIQSGLTSEQKPPDWILAAVKGVLAAWHAGKDYLEEFHIEYLEHNTPVDSQPLQPAIGGFSPRQETRQEFEERARRTFDESLGQYGDSIESAWQGRGWRPVPRRKDCHFEWLVRYQINHEPATDIANSVGARVTSSAVKKALRETSRAIGLSLRSEKKRGRPSSRKTRESPKAARTSA